MTAVTDTLARWLTQAQIDVPALTPEQHAVLHAVFAFRQQQGTDYYSTRLLSHFLLHCHSGLKVAHIARLLGLSRPTASRQQGCSSKEAIQQAHQRMDGRPYGKLLPRYAGPIAQFLLTHPQAARREVLDVIDHTWGVRVSTVALHKFLHKFGLDQATRQALTTLRAEPRPAVAVGTVEPPTPASAAESTAPRFPAIPRTPSLPLVPSSQPGVAPAPPFSAHTRTMPGPSC